MRTAAVMQDRLTLPIRSTIRFCRIVRILSPPTADTEQGPHPAPVRHDFRLGTTSRPHSRSGRTFQGGFSMRMQTAACLATVMLAGLTGCSTPHATTRGQSNSIYQSGHESHNVHVVPNRSGNVTSVQNHLHDAHDFPSTQSYHSTSGFPGYNGFAQSGYNGGYGSCPPGGCPSGGYGSYGSCPSGACPPGACPSGHCGAGCGCGLGGNYHSYSYERPANLSYPDQNAVGGAVVYPVLHPQGTKRLLPRRRVGAEVTFC